MSVPLPVSCISFLCPSGMLIPRQDDLEIQSRDPQEMGSLRHVQWRYFDHGLWPSPLHPYSHGKPQISFLLFNKPRLFLPPHQFLFSASIYLYSLINVYSPVPTALPKPANGQFGNLSSLSLLATFPCYTRSSNSSRAAIPPRATLPAVGRVTA